MAVPVEGFAALDTVDDETAASATGGVAAALAESALPCHVEHAGRNLFLHASSVLLIVTHADDGSCALYLVDCSAWPIFRELLGCSIPCLREHLVIIVFCQRSDLGYHRPSRPSTGRDDDACFYYFQK